MKSTTDKGKQAGWTYDLRVRDRLLARGELDPKLVERHLADLPDLEANAETLTIEQPALGDGSES